MRLAHVPAMPRPPPLPAPPPPRAAVLADDVGAASNPFAKASLYVGVAHRVQLLRALNGSASVASRAAASGLLSAWSAPVAFWIDSMSAIRDGAGSGKGGGGMSVPSTAEGVLRDAAAQAAGGQPPLVVLVLHALPNRDCHRPGSPSAICCHYESKGQNGAAQRAGCDFLSEGSTGDCLVGLDDYRKDVVDELAGLLEEYEARASVAVVLEPGSFASLALGASAPSCQGAATLQSYTDGIAYAVQQLSVRAPRAALYLDAGDGGQLGWGNRARSFVTLVSRLGRLAFRLRGFATNVGGYQPLGLPCPLGHGGVTLPTYCRQHPHDPCCDDPCALIERYNSGAGELNYVQLLDRHLRVAMPGLQPRFVVDTGRQRLFTESSGAADCTASCNLRNAGLGPRPTSNTGLSTVDAYLWVRAPGASDGCTRTRADGASAVRTCSNSNPACALVDAVGTQPNEPAPPASGELYPPLLRSLATQAVADATLAYADLAKASREMAAFGKAMGTHTAWPMHAVREFVRADVEDGTLQHGLGVSGSVVALLLALLVAREARLGFVRRRRSAARAADVASDDADKDQDRAAERRDVGASANRKERQRCGQVVRSETVGLLQGTGNACAKVPDAGTTPQAMASHAQQSTEGLCTAMQPSSSANLAPAPGNDAPFELVD